MFLILVYPARFENYFMIEIYGLTINNDTNNGMLTLGKGKVRIETRISTHPLVYRNENLNLAHLLQL